MKKGRFYFKKDLLIKATEPNKWDLSGAGHISYGELPIETAKREIFEETGINVELSKIKLIGTYLVDFNLNDKVLVNHYTYLFVTLGRCDLANVSIQKEEVQEVRYFNKKEYSKIINSNLGVEGLKYCNKIIEYLK